MCKGSREFFLLKIARKRGRQFSQTNFECLHHTSLGLLLLAPIQHELFSLERFK